MLWKILTGWGYSGGSGTACNGLYTACTCSSRYEWSGDSCKACSSSYKYTCTGTGYSGGSGTACGGKYYTACKCSDNYFWSGKSCAVKNDCMKGSQLGYILNSDMTITPSKQSGKTPIGVVICSYASGGGQAISLQRKNDRFEWETTWTSSGGTDISSLPNYSTSQSAYKDIASCENTEKIRAQGDSNIYKAAWKAYNYKTAGTEIGDWCLPAAGVITSYYANKGVIDRSLESVGGTIFTGEGSVSSTERDDWGVWHAKIGGEYALDYYGKGANCLIRPVIEF